LNTTYSLIFIKFIAGILLLILGGVAATLGIGGSIIDLPQVAIGIIVLGVYVKFSIFLLLNSHQTLSLFFFRIVIILAFFGCCGARKERRSLLTIVSYSLFL
jgi:hypothetical protein